MPLDIWTTRNHGRARVGEQVYHLTCGQCGTYVTITMALSPLNGLVPHTEQICGMNARLFNDFSAQARQNLNPDDLVIFIYDGAPAHRNANNSRVVQSLRCCLLKVRFSISWNKRSVFLKLQSRPISLNLPFKS